MPVDHAVSHLGKCQGIVNIIRGIPYNVKLRRISIPQDILLNNNVSYENVIRNSNEKNVRDAIYEMASRANSHLIKVNLYSFLIINMAALCVFNVHIFQANKLEKDVDKRVKSIFLPFTPLRLYLDKLQKVDFNVFDKTLQQRDNLLPMKLLWYKITH